MEIKYTRLKVKIFSSLILAIVWAILIFSLAQSAVGQTLITDPSDGHYCEGDPGVSICVENTVIGQNYYVMHNGDTVNCIIGDGLTVCCNGFTDPGDYTTIPPTNTVTITVDPLPVLPTITGDFYLCGYYNLTTYVTYENLPTSDYTFTWQAFGYVNGGAPAMGFYALPDENTLDVIWGNADYGTLIVTVIDNITGCDISSVIYTVNICPVITNDIIYGDTSICYGTNACFTGTVPSGGCGPLSYLWQVSTDGVTWMAAWCCNPMANDTVDYCTPDLPGPATYYLRRIVSGLACESTSNVVTLTVYAEFLPGVIAADQTICYNTVPNPLGEVLPATGGDGTYTYQWQSDVNCLGVWTDIPGAVATGYQPLALIDTTCYRRIDMNLCDTLVTNVVTIDVWDLFIPGIIGNDQSICYNTIPTQLDFISPPTGGSPGNYTYQWQKDVNCLGVWIDIPLATGTSYLPPNLIDTTCFRVMVFNQCDTLPTNIVTVNVWDEFIVDPIPQQDTSICYLTPLAPNCILLGPVTAVGGECNANPACYTYQWYNSGGPIAGETNASICLDSLIVTDTYYCMITDLSCGTLQTPNSITITVWDPFDEGTIGFVPNECTEDSVAVCKCTAPPCITFCPPYPIGGEPGVYTFQWFVSFDSQAWSPIAGQINDSLCPDTLCVDRYYKCQVTNLCATGVTNTVKVHVWEEFLAGNIGFDPWCLDEDTVCYNTAPDSIWFCNMLPSGGNTVAGYTYQWYESFDNTTYNPIAGAIQDGYQPPPLITDYWYYCEVTNECGILNTDTVHVMVWDEFLAGDIGFEPWCLDADTVCYNTAPDSIWFCGAPSTGGNTILGYTYQWYNSGGLIAGAIFSGYQPPALTSNEYYFAEVTNECGVLHTDTVVVHVWDDLAAGEIANNQTICSNTIPDSLYFPIIPTGGECDGDFTCYTYQWQESVNCTGIWTDIVGATDTIYQPPALFDTTCYRVVVTDFCGFVETNVVQIDVWDPLVVGEIGFDYLNTCLQADTACYNTPPGCIGFCIPPTGGEPGLYDYLWYFSLDSINFSPVDPPAINPEYCPPALTQTTYYKCQVTNPCETGVTNIVTAFVWEEFLAGNIGFDPWCFDSDTVCYNTAPECITFCGAVPTGGNTLLGYTYQWYESTDNVLFTSVAGALANTYCPPQLLVDHWYYCEVTNQCGVLSTDTVNVKVWSEFMAGSVGFELDPCALVTETICSGEIPSLIDECTPPEGGDMMYTFQWQVDTLCDGTWDNIVGAISAIYQPPALINPSLTDSAAISYCFRRIDMNFCDTLPTNSVEVIVNPLPPPFEILPDSMVCANSIVEYCVDPPDENPLYTYNWTVQGGTLDPDSCCYICSLIHWGTGPEGIIIVTKENILTGCQIYDTLIVQINPIPNPVISGPVIVDQGDTATYSVPLLPNQVYSWFVTGGSIFSGGGSYQVSVVWGNAGMGHVQVAQKDNNYTTGCCGVADLDVTINPVGVPDISGQVTYNNSYSTLMNTVDIDLRDNLGVVVQSVSTHFDINLVQNGFYDFYNVLNGNYTLGVTTGIPFGGVNATDALAIKLHAIAQPGFILTGLPLASADVNGSGSVNATDALYVIYRTINYITDFPSGDWMFDNQPLSFSGASVVNNIMGQCFGDVNGSYIPTGFKDSYNYELLTDGAINIEPGDVFELPVRALNSTKLGAMSLFLSYQNELVEVIDITTIDNDNMLYTVDDNSVRIAWSNTSGYTLADDEIVVTLKLKALEDITHDDRLISLNEGSEFADEIAKVIETMTLKTIGVSTNGNMGYALSHNFPNPFNEYTDIQYTIPEDGRVVLSVYNVLGNKVSTLVDAFREAGTYTQRFIVKDNNPGVYIYELQVDGVTTDYNDLKKMVIQ